MSRQALTQPTDRAREILALLDGRPFSQVAKTVGLTPERVYQIARRWAPDKIRRQNGIQKHPRPRGFRHELSTIRTIERLWLNGVSTQKIADIITEQVIQMTSDAVIGLAHRHGFPPHPSCRR